MLNVAIFAAKKFNRKNENINTLFSKFISAAEIKLQNLFTVKKEQYTYG